MSSSYLGIVITFGVAAIVSTMDLLLRKDKGFYRRVILHCGLFVILDTAAALLLFIVSRAGAELLKASPITAAAVTAGLVGPLLMRTKIPLPFTKGKQMVNAVAMLRRLQIGVAAEIDDLCAAGETAWILDKVLPALMTLPLSEVEAWVTQSINVKYSQPEARMLRSKYLKDVLGASSDAIKEEDRKHLLVQILIDRCGRRHVTALVRRARRWSSNASSRVAVEPQATKELGAAASNDGPIINPDTDDSGGARV